MFSKPVNFGRIVVSLGSWITGVGLILLAIQCFVWRGAAQGYGVSPIDENGFAYSKYVGTRFWTGSFEVNEKTRRLDLKVQHLVKALQNASQDDIDDIIQTRKWNFIHPWLEAAYPTGKVE